ncbi:sigma-70 family RNA polymerase sigma factor [Streptomyces pakalii]|uniref:RNA polymerase sigma-70 region 2 domain-containing protein n=1 Tax=Streptomyces pakalii TaxID=3036494 RepID=A0ABT7D7L8_9ACTN|nr:hypothetical protein [Streptomyces pakalii]MDJ1641804.1 hypothetical protein [Streptomyces pakalii]
MEPGVRQEHPDRDHAQGAAWSVPGRATAHADDLLVQIAHGSVKALAELYDLVAPLFLALPRSRRTTADQADDALVGAFVQVFWRTALPYSPGTTALDWMRRRKLSA